MVEQSQTTKTELGTYIIEATRQVGGNLEAQPDSNPCPENYCTFVWDGGYPECIAGQPSRPQAPGEYKLFVDYCGEASSTAGQGDSDRCYWLQWIYWFTTCKRNIQTT